MGQTKDNEGSKEVLENELQTNKISISLLNDPNISDMENNTNQGHVEEVNDSSITSTGSDLVRNELTSNAMDKPAIGTEKLEDKKVKKTKKVQPKNDNLTTTEKL